MGQFFGWQIQTKVQELSLHARRATDTLIDQIIYGFSETTKDLAILESLEMPLLSMMDAAGFVLFLGDEFFEVGKVPRSDITRQLAAEFLKASAPVVQSSHQLSKDFPCFETDEEQSLAGALFIPLSPKHGYFAIWFRPEKIHTVRWAGAPQVKNATEEQRLSPRGSFALWRETVKGKSLEWTDADIKTAERFNKLFVSHVIDRKIDV